MTEDFTPAWRPSAKTLIEMTTVKPVAPRAVRARWTFWVVAVRNILVMGKGVKGQGAGKGRSRTRSTQSSSSSNMLTPEELAWLDRSVTEGVAQVRAFLAARKKGTTGSQSQEPPSDSDDQIPQLPPAPLLPKGAVRAYLESGYRQELKRLQELCRRNSQSS